MKNHGPFLLATLNRFSDRVLNLEFRHLLTGTVIIIGFCFILIPVLSQNKTFEKHVL
jgi:hypothetical protein